METRNGKERKKKKIQKLNKDKIKRKNGGKFYALYPCVLVLVMAGAATMAAPQECCFYANTLDVEVRVGA